MKHIGLVLLSIIMTACSNKPHKPHKPPTSEVTFSEFRNTKYANKLCSNSEFTSCIGLDERLCSGATFLFEFECQKSANEATASITDPSIRKEEAFKRYRRCLSFGAFGSAIMAGRKPQEGCFVKAVMEFELQFIDEQD